MTKRSNKSRNIIGVVLVVLIGLVVWSIVTTVTAESKAKDKHLGIAEYEKGNYQEAIRHYENGLKSHPDDACLFNNRGLAYYSLEDYDKAIDDYTKAIDDYTKAIGLRLDFADAYYNRGLAYFKKGSCYNFEPRQKAIDDFTRAIELVPDSADGYCSRALAYTEQVHYHHKYATIPPKFPSEDMDNYNKALADYTMALALNPSYVLAYQGKGNLFYRHGDWDLATREYNKALTDEKEILKTAGYEGLAGVYNSRGRNYLAAGKLEEAICDFTKAVDYYEKAVVNKDLGLSKNTTNALAHRTVAAWELGRWEDTIKYADENIEVKENNPKKYGTATFYYFTKGRCYYHLGRYDDAIANLEKALSEAKYGMDTKARLWLGRVYKKQGEAEQAKHILQEALEFSDKNIKKADESKLHKLYLTRGMIYLELDEYDKAIPDFNETIKRRVRADRPVNHTSYYLDAHKYIGIAYMKAGNKAKAEEYFQKTIELAKKRDFEEVMEETNNLLANL
ncbi:MAG: hypothetical protein BA865_06840 [Desulfobacterales bacterium S5133MH4]|nr:MAG: hypothetical protein BA865_06840 [Desulfobacterales bacterium S5133MH4]